MREDGSALVLVLIILVVLVTLTSALGAVLGSGISLSSFNEHRIRAVYNAEAAIEEALNIIIDNHNTLDQSAVRDKILAEAQGTLFEGVDYRITEVEFPDSSSYRLTAEGKSGKVTKKLKQR